jgi:hypothetical protein
VWQAIRSLEVTMIKFAVAGLALGVLLAVSLGVTVTILLMMFN